MSRGRRTPRTTATILAISDGYRATHVAFMADGDLDPRERHALRLLSTATGHAAWADWQRKARNSYEDHGHVNGGLERERRELSTLYGDEPTEVA